MGGPRTVHRIRTLTPLALAAALLLAACGGMNGASAPTAPRAEFLPARVDLTPGVDPFVAGEEADGKEPPGHKKKKKKLKLVRRKHLGTIVAAWVVTVPLAAGLAALLFVLLDWGRGVFL